MGSTAAGNLAGNGMTRGAGTQGQGCCAQEGGSNEGILSENNPAQGKGKTEAQKGRNVASWGRKYSLKHSGNQEQLHYMAPSKYFQSDM